jgi:poly-gamma-glutamate synthesis protein (capsule biosynthesis protein)
VISNQRRAYEGCGAQLEYSGGRLKEIILHPLDLQFDADLQDLGRPRLADPPLGKQIIERVAALSARYGTKIRYDIASNTGRVRIP